MDNFKENMRSNSVFSSFVQITYTCSSAGSALCKCAKNRSIVQTFELKLYLQYQNWKNYMILFQLQHSHYSQPQHFHSLQMNIHLAVSSQVPNQEKVNEVQKVIFSYGVPWHSFLKGLYKYNNIFITNNASINRPLYKYLRKNFMEISNEVYHEMCSATKGMAPIIIRN